MHSLCACIKIDRLSAFLQEAHCVPLWPGIKLTNYNFFLSTALVLCYLAGQKREVLTEMPPFCLQMADRKRRDSAVCRKNSLVPQQRHCEGNCPSERSFCCYAEGWGPISILLESFEQPSIGPANLTSPPWPGQSQSPKKEICSVPVYWNKSGL